MAISQKSKLEIIQSLLVTKQKAHSLEISLRFKAMNDEADEVSQKAGELSQQIDTLLGQVIDDWFGQTGAILESIGKANSSLQRSIRQIQKGLSIARNLVKAVGYIDDVVSIAAKLSSVA